MNNKEIIRPRCKGTCGDAECEEAEKSWRAANGVAPLPEQLWLFDVETEEVFDMSSMGVAATQKLTDYVEPSKRLMESWFDESKETPYVPIVIIESPYAGDVQTNTAYLRAALHDCLMRGEAPFASHGLYTQCLDDTVPEERAMGIQAGFAFREVSDYTVVYEDLGISPGMQLGIDDAHKKTIPVKYRSLPGWRKEDTLTK